AMPRSEAEARAALEKGLRYMEMAEKRQRLVRDEFAKDPVLVHPLGSRNLPAVGGPLGGEGLVWTAFDWAGKSEAMRRELARVAQSSRPVASLHAKAMLALLDPHTAPISANPSFEELQGRWPAAWRPWINERTGSLT